MTRVVGTAEFPPQFAAAGYAPCFKGFGPPPGKPPDGSLDGVRFVERADVHPEKAEGAAQHVALFKNVLVAADGGASARLHVYDVRDWKLKQTIRVGEVSEATTGDSSGSGGPAAAAVSALAFDGMTIAVGTHQGHVHTWKLMEHEGKRGYVRLLQPLRVDTLPITKVHLSPDAQLLTAYSPSKRTLVVWDLTTGKLKSAFTVDQVAHGVPMRLTANVGSILACVHAHPEDIQDGVEKKSAPPLAALLDVATGEGGSVRDVGVLENEGEPLCVAFDGELLAVGTSSGAVVAWNVAEGYAAWKGYHGGAVGALATVPGEPARLLSGGADRAVLLWDKEGRVQARLEVGAGVTALTAPTPHTAVCGTSAGMVELLALCKADAEHDEALTGRAKNGRATGNDLVRYAWKHDPAGARHASFDDFTRRVPVKEGPMPAGGTGAEEQKPRPKSKAEKERETSMAKGMMRGLRESVSEEESDEATAARKKKEEEIEKAKHRAMDGEGVARNPDVRATLDGIRRCSNPTCVEREDTIAGRMLRCSRCKEAVYCSSHCQRTHWRDGHKAKCAPPTKPKPEASEPPAASEPKPRAKAPPPSAPTPQRRALVVEDDSEDDAEEDEPRTERTEPVAVQRRALVVEEDSEDDSDEDEPAAPAEAPAAPERRALVIEEEDDDSDDSDAEDGEDGEAADDSDDDTPALPPWMTVNKPPGFPCSDGEGTSAGGRRSADAPPPAKPVEVQPPPSPPPSPPRRVADPALEPVDTDDLLYDLD